MYQGKTRIGVLLGVIHGQVLKVSQIIQFKHFSFSCTIFLTMKYILLLPWFIYSSMTIQFSYN